MKTKSILLKLLPPVVYSIEIVWFVIIVQHCFNGQPLLGLLSGLLLYQLSGTYVINNKLGIPLNFLEIIYWEIIGGLLLLLAGSCIVATIFSAAGALIYFILLIVFPTLMAFHQFVILSELLSLCCWFTRYKKSSK